MDTDFQSRLLIHQTKYARMKKEDHSLLLPHIVRFIDELREAQRKGRKWRRDLWLPLTSHRMGSKQILDLFGKGIGINTQNRRDRVLQGLENLLEMAREVQEEFDHFCELYFKLKETQADGTPVLELYRET